MKIRSILFICMLQSIISYSQEIIIPKVKVIDPSFYHLKKLAKLPENINEASGLETFDNKTFWTHNDGGIPVLFGIDSSGKIIKTVHLKNKNKGWEDLTKDKIGNLYIGGFGNNNSNKKLLKIYKIPRPDSISAKITLAEVISFQYEDQDTYPPSADKNNFDVDAFFHLNDSLYLFSKNRTNPYNHLINIYALPDQPGEYVAKKIDSFQLEGNMLDNWITGADISDDDKTIALLFHGKIILIENFIPPYFSKGSFKEYQLNHYTHKAGIVFVSANSLLLVDEIEMGFIGGYLYHFNLKTVSEY